MMVKWKSKIGLCLISKPKESYIIHIDDNGHKTIELVGRRSPDKCPYCGKSWEEH